MKKPNMSLKNRGTKTKKAQNYIKASLVLTALFFIIYQATNPAVAQAPVRCVNHCGNLPIAEDKEELTVAEQIRQLARKHHFQWEDYLVRLAFCESRFDKYATNMNGGHSLDRGVFQWNKKYHPEISDECAFDIECSTIETMEAINNGKQKMWMCNNIILNK